MKHGIATIALTIAALIIFASQPSFAFMQQTTANRNKSVKGEMKESGKEAGKAGTSLGHNVKHGRVARGGKSFGKHAYQAGKHFGKGSAKAAKKTGQAVKNAAKP
jgi:hypothetical protein